MKIQEILFMKWYHDRYIRIYTTVSIIGLNTYFNKKRNKIVGAFQAHKRTYVSMTIGILKVGVERTNTKAKPTPNINTSDKKAGLHFMSLDSCMKITQFRSHLNPKTVNVCAQAFIYVCSHVCLSSHFCSFLPNLFSYKLFVLKNK